VLIPPHRCLFNGTVAQFDPYLNEVLDIFEFANISNTGIEHASGIDWNPHDGLLSIVIDAEPAFLTDGADPSGTYWLLKFDPVRRELLWKANLTSVTQARWSGFQDVTTDSHGNAYVAGTYPSSIMRVDKTGRHIQAWYPPQTTNTSVHGYTGIDSTGSTILVVDNLGVPEQASDGHSAIFRFDMDGPAPHLPVRVPVNPDTPIPVSDTVTIPRKYGGAVLLVSLDLVGVAVLRSRDGWATAEQLGTVTSDFGLINTRDLPATVHIADRIFMIGEYFPGTFVPGTVAGSQIDFPMFDITEQVEALLGEW
jgi:hypothetical protein